MEGNKDEGVRCFHLAKSYFSQGNCEKALKFLLKAKKLNPSGNHKEFEEVLLAEMNTPSSKEGPDVNSRTDTNGPSSATRHRPSATGSTSSSTSSTSSPASEAPSYTAEQLQAVKKVRGCKDYYEILGVNKEVTDSDLKKAYRKMALQFHPDKNKAPGADEAFKAVGNAMSVLSDTEKRKTYDLYGPEERMQRHQHTRDHHHAQQDVTAEELFNMFFGGVPTQYGGRVFTRTHGGARMRQHHSDDHNGASIAMQLLPLLLILVLSVFSSLFTADPVFSLNPNSKYTDQRMTTRLRVSYYVRPDFAQEFQGSVRRLEQQVEEEYVSVLRNGCYKERNHRENMLWRARSFGDAAMYRRANEMQTPSCDTLQAVYS